MATSNAPCAAQAPHTSGHAAARPWRALALLLTACVAGLATVTAPPAMAAGPAGAPPPAPSVPAQDSYFGVSVADPFRNLEDQKDPRTQAWMKAQGEYAAAQLGRIEGRAALAQRLDALSRAIGTSAYGFQRRPGGRVFYMKRPAGASQFMLVMRQGLDGADRVLLDPDELSRARGVPHAINYFAASNDGRTLAYGVSAGGSEQADLHLIDVASGRALREPIPRVNWSQLSWSPGDRWLSFNQQRALPPGASESETYLDSTVYVLDRRHPQAAPRAVFGPLVNPGLRLERLDFGELIFSADSRYMVARTTDTTVPEGKLFVAPVAALDRATPVPWRALSTAADKITHVQLRGPTLFLRSYLRAPRGEVLALPLADARLSRAVTVVAEPARGVLRDFVLGRRAVYAEVSSGFTVRTLRVDPARPGAGVDVAPGQPGSTLPIGGPPGGGDDLWLLQRTWTAPLRVLAQRSAAAGGWQDTGLRDARRPDGVPALSVHEVEVPSHDGTMVPLAIVHREGLALDGRRPTLLEGYGAYGLSMEAWYNPLDAAWFERDGVMAFVNPRGSGAFGDAWHRAGFKATKPNTWKDGIAAARWLVAQGYTSPATLAVEGGSAGGIFAGRAATEAPELFAAAILNVGVLDAMRFETTANGATNVSEFGSVKVESEVRPLLAMSSYHQIRDDTAYPAVLLIHGMNDPRVDVWHSAKAAARLQQASTSGKPVLLRLDAQAGHGMGSTRQQQIEERVDAWSFLLWQFGLRQQTAASP